MKTWTEQNEMVPALDLKLLQVVQTIKPSDDELKQKLQDDLQRFDKIVDDLLRELRTLRADARRLGRRFR